MPYALTAATLADVPLRHLLDVEDDRREEALFRRAEVIPSLSDWDARRRVMHERLELVAAFTSFEEVAALTGVDSDVNEDSFFHPGIRLRLTIPVPDAADETALDRTLDLVQDAGFEHARRSMWSWEQELPADPSTDDVTELLTGLVAE